MPSHLRVRPIANQRVTIVHHQLASVKSIDISQTVRYGSGKLSCSPVLVKNSRSDSGFKIENKKPNDPSKSIEIHTSENLESKESKDEHSNVGDSEFKVNETGKVSRKTDQQISINALKKLKQQRKRRKGELEKLHLKEIGNGVFADRRMQTGYNIANIESVAAVKKLKTNKHENQPHDDPVVSSPRLIVPPSKGTPKSQAVNLAPVIRETKTVKRTVKVTKAVYSSGDDTDAVPEKRISLPQLRKTRRIVSKKLHPVTSVNTLSGMVSPKKDVRGKRHIIEASGAQNAVPTKRKRLSSDTNAIKNSNPDWNCLNKTIECQLCKKSVGISLVSHYVNCHPNNEVFPCRVAPFIADFLRNSAEVHEVERFMPKGKLCNEFKQRCYFCNEIKSFTKSAWAKHMIVHSGYYRYKCTNCKRRFAASTPYHACRKGKVKNRVVKEAQPQFNETDVFAYLCDLCNFVRLEESEMKNHLTCEHTGNVARKFKKVVFLRFPKNERKNEIVGAKTMATKSCKRSKTVANIDDDARELLEHSPQKVLQFSVVPEAFKAELNEGNRLSDHDTVKLMKGTPVGGAECTPRSNNRTNSIDEKINSLQVDGQDGKIISTNTTHSDAMSLDLLTCDERIPFVGTVLAKDRHHTMHTTVKETLKEKTMPTTAASVKEEYCIPTKEFFNESNDNWRSCLLEDGEDERVLSIQVSSSSNRKNVGLKDSPITTILFQIFILILTSTFYFLLYFISYD